MEYSGESNELYGENFLEAGGKEYEMVESLNDSSIWVKAIKEIIMA